MASTLNPYAVPFVPVAYRAVEDFSPEWWQLVESSAWFRDYWLRECFHEEDQTQDEEDDDDEYDPQLLDNYGSDLPDTDSLFYQPQQEEVKEKAAAAALEVVTWGSEKWRGPRGRLEGNRYMDKAPKIVSLKLSPRTIQQPR